MSKQTVASDIVEESETEVFLVSATLSLFWCVSCLGLEKKGLLGRTFSLSFVSSPTHTSTIADIFVCLDLCFEYYEWMNEWNDGTYVIYMWEIIVLLGAFNWYLVLDAVAHRKERIMTDCILNRIYSKVWDILIFYSVGHLFFLLLLLRPFKNFSGLRFFW